ncbi:hypothetical protein P7C73_g4448, partial [Tremellales sp. Uapishka_1]
MNDIIAAAVGGEVTDRSFIATNAAKPVWHLVPLPLSQIDPSSTTEPLLRGPIPSLHSLCLASISQNFHLFAPSSFAGVSPVLVGRILSRVRADRRYESLSTDTTLNPDEATIWAYSAMLDPENTARSLSLGLPPSSTLLHLPENPLSAHTTHPINLLPSLYKSLQPHSSLALLMTLSFDGIGQSLDDSSLMALKWCTHLSGLWMRGCTKVTDLGIRLLGSALVLPGQDDDGEGRGLCRLRGWWLTGCTGVSDRSMKVFARWPGLVVLDVRDTSCTTAAIDIFNRSSQALFAHNPDFQPCTPGLTALFSSRDPPSDTIHNLSQTLLGPNVNYLSLHIVPSHQPLSPQWQPEPPVSRPRADFTALTSRTSVYRGGGIGQIYGSGVSYIPDIERDQRDNLAIALRIEAEEETAGSYSKKRRSPWDRDLDVKPRKPEIYKEKKVKGQTADERSRRFAVGVRADVEEESIRGARELMMVRMVHEQWEKLSWVPGGARRAISTIVPTAPIRVDTGSTQIRKGKGNIVGDILGATAKPPIPTPSNPFKPKPTSMAPTQSPSPRLSTPMASNPFRNASQALRPNPLAADSLSFAAPSTKKRDWSGGSGTVEAKRRGMKMFGGAR